MKNPSPMKRNSHIQINIPKPCNQGWNTMSPTDKGRFCDSCRKDVIDFTKFTDRELIHFFSNQKTRVCGHFSKSQLNRNLAAQHTTNKKLILPPFILGVALALGLVNKSEAQVISSQTLQTEPDFNNNPQEGKKITSDSITGRVIYSETNEYIPGVTVLIKGTSIGTATDVDGKFSILFPESMNGQEITLEFSGIGIETKEVVMNTNDFTGLEIKLYPPTDEDLQVIIIGYAVAKRPGLGYYIKRLFTRKEYR